ncbi:LysM peptidoglycan-binding domain-containing protein [Paenibacillus sp. FSL M8-0334]|uniref:LysM peptidoglycan-binding domain-containing protein n=1 Tax=Paenibacillus sp. FSL M8-0334 TaxID=2921623 RepID=UPI0030FB2C2B
MLRYSTYRSIYDTVPAQQESVAERWMKRARQHMSTIPAIKIVLLLFIIVSGWTGAYTVFAGGADKPVQAVEFIVQPGDSLWSIASSQKPKNTDTRVYLEHIRRYNGLKGTEIQAGEVLKLPVW